MFSGHGSLQLPRAESTRKGGGWEQEARLGGFGRVGGTRCTLTGGHPGSMLLSGLNCVPGKLKCCSPSPQHSCV